MRTATLLLGVTLTVLAVIHTTSAGCDCGCKKALPSPVKKCGCGARKAKALPLVARAPCVSKKCGCGGKIIGAVVPSAPLKRGCGGCGKIKALPVPLPVKKEPCGGDDVRSWVAANYKQKSGEDLETYFSRITCKDGISDEEYIKRLSICRSLFGGLDLWYSRKYFGRVKRFYSLFYARKRDETDDCYFQRLVTKDSFESEVNWANRVNLLRELHPSLRLWYDETFYSKYTKHFFEVFYRKGDSESSESYLKRVFAKVAGETDDCFWKRVKLVQKTFPKYTCWYEKENLKKIDVCQSISNARSEEELKKQIASQESSGCNKDKLECLQTFFKSSKSSSQSSSSSASSEESVVVKSSC